MLSSDTKKRPCTARAGNAATESTPREPSEQSVRTLEEDLYFSALARSEAPESTLREPVAPQYEKEASEALLTKCEAENTPTAEEDNSHQCEPEPRRSLLGLSLILCGILVFASIAMLVKKLQHDRVPFLQVSFVRYLVVMVFAFTGIRLTDSEMPLLGNQGDRSALFARAGLYYGALNLYYWALLYIPLGMCTVLGYSFPFVTAVISHFGLCSDREQLTARGWGCCLAGFAGIVLVVSPWSASVDGSTGVGVALTVGSAVCWAVQIIVIRRTRARSHWLQVEFVTAVMHSLVMTPIAWGAQWCYLRISGDVVADQIVNLTISSTSWAILVAIGCIAFVGLGCSTRGFQLEEAPRGAIIMYLEIPFIYVCQWLFFSTSPSLTECIGVALVLIACIISAVEKVT